MTTPTPFAPGYRLTDGDQLNVTVANPYWSTTASASATSGGTMATSTKIVNAVTNITSVPVTGAGVTLPQALAGQVLVVTNNGANDLRLFAAGGSTINGAPGASGILLPKGITGIFVALATKIWSQLNTATPAGQAGGQIIYGSGTGGFASSQYLFWDSVNNRLGVGTATPQVPIQVTQETGANVSGWYSNYYTQSSSKLYFTELANISSIGNGEGFYASYARGTYAVPAFTQVGDTLGYFGWGAYSANTADPNGLGYDYSTAVAAVVDTTPTTGLTPSAIVFYTQGIGTPGSEKFRISSSGNLVATGGGSILTSGTVQMGSSFLRNRIINGDMRIDQRNAGASGTAIGYTIDRWTFASSLSTKGTWQQNAGSVTPPAGYTNYLGFTSNSAYSVGATDYFTFGQVIEGYNIADFGFGTANAKTITISFWVRSSLTGTFGGALQNSGSSRCYAFSYTISSANTWEQKTITVTGDTTGTWLTNNGTGLGIYFSIGCGTTYSGTAGSWSSSVYVSATGAQSVVGTNGATFYITGVQLEVGSVATPFERRLYAQEIALAQRYFWAVNGQVGTNGAVNQLLPPVVPFPQIMRASPTINGSAAFTASVGNNGTVAVAGYTPNNVYLYNSAANWSATAYNAVISLNAQFSAEL
jgi:hypothetical protein